MKFALAFAIAAPAFVASDDEMGWTGVLDEDSFAALHDLRSGASPELLGEDVEVGDSTAYLSLPQHGPAIGGVVVIHEWWGLNDHVKHWADRLAADGYAALAVDLYGGVVATTRDEALETMQSVDEAEALAILREAHAFLEDDARVEAEKTASIGWCFGGGWSLRLAMAEPELDAAVIYYGRLVTDPEPLGAIEARVLGIFGDRDTGIPPESVEAFRDAMDEAGVDLEVHSYDAEHAFANPSGARYDAENAADAWGHTRRFLCETLWPDQPGGTFHDGLRTFDVETPEGWTDAGPRTMRTLNYTARVQTECYVTVLPGHAGGLEANVQRWCQQMGADPLAADEIELLPRIPMLGQLAPTVRIDGRYTSMSGDTIESAALLGTVCVRDDEVIFVKMIGPSGEVDSEAARFAGFCRALR